MSNIVKILQTQPISFCNLFLFFLFRNPPAEMYENLAFFHLHLFAAVQIQSVYAQFLAFICITLFLHLHIHKQTEKFTICLE